MAVTRDGRALGGNGSPLKQAERALWRLGTALAHSADGAGGVPGILVQDCSFGSASSLVPRGYCFECSLPWHPHVPLFSPAGASFSSGSLGSPGGGGGGGIPGALPAAGPAGLPPLFSGPAHYAARTALALDLPSFQRLSQDSSVFGSPAAMELSTGSDPFSPPPSAPGVRAGSAFPFPFRSGGAALLASGSPGSPGTSPFSSPAGSASPLLGGPFPYSPVALSSAVGSLSPASSAGSGHPLLGGPFPYSPVALSSAVGSLSTASPLSGGPFSFPSGSPGISSGTYSSSSGGGGGGGGPLDGSSQQLWWDPVGGLAPVPDYYYSPVERPPLLGGGGPGPGPGPGPSPSPADGAPGGSADGAASPLPGALVPAFPGARPRPGPLMVPPHGVFSPPNYPALRVSPGQGQPFFTFPTAMGVAPAPSAPLVGATAMPQKLTEGKPREQRAHATSLSGTKSPKDTRQVTLERIVGEIAFQLDRRILSSIFPDRIRLYGYTVGNIPEKIAQGGSDPLSPLTPEQRSSMMEHYNAIMTRLKPQGYDPTFHPQFTEHIVNTYGILRERPDTAGSERDTYNDPAYLREVIENVVPIEKRADCIVLLVCLQMLSKADGKPLFIW